MKKIYSFIGTLLLCGTMALAQSPTNRTSKTIVADVLAQMPAEEQANYNKLIKDLSTTGEPGVLQLVSMMHAPGKGSNAQVEYALSGLSHFVMATGEDNSRLIVANAYLKALDQVSERKTKAFIIRQLDVVGKDESIDKLASYLSDESLSAPAAQVLATINSEKSKQALFAALNTSNGKPQIDIVNALGFTQSTQAEPKLLTLLGTTDIDLKKAVLYALGRTGTKVSLKALADEALKAGYTMDKGNGNDAYIALIKRVLSQGDVKDAEKAATNLLKDATKADKTQTRDAALYILLSIQKENGIKLVLSALKDQDKAYRNAALIYTSDFANQSTYNEIVKAIAKVKNDNKIDIINWLGRESRCPVKNEMIRKANAVEVLQGELYNSDFQVQEAAAWSLVRIGNKSSIPSLAKLLTSSSKDAVLLGQGALASFDGDISPTVASVIPTAQDAGKIAALELLALRNSTPNMSIVLEQTKSESPEVKAAAYSALKYVVTEKDLTGLYTMLESADASAIAPLQEAVVSAVSFKPKSQQQAEVIRQMQKAGDNKKHLYYSVLATIGDDSVLDILTTGFNSGRGAAKDAAFEALLLRKNIETADVLYAICKDTASSAYFDRALEAYIKLVSNPAYTGENRLLSLKKAMEIAKTDAQKNAILAQVGRTNTFLGLIFAGEYLDQKPVQQRAAHAVMNIALENKDFTGKNVEALLNKVIEVLDNPDAQYQREAIRKHLAEMSKEEGYVSLFNGKDLTGWKGLVENPIARAKMKPAQLAKAQEKADEQMRKDWKVENGLLIFDGKGYDNICSQKQYGDIEMYIDWMLDPAGPEADAGIYLRGTPQVQMWDIARTNVGAEVGSGGLYNNQKNPSKPLKVADNKLGEWNTLYIKMVGDRVTVKLNGELVTDNIILENFWDRSQPLPAIEQLELQAHGSKVYYRDIYVKELERTEPFKLSAEEQKDGYKILFDGTNMHEWTGNTVDYTMEDGTISLDPSKTYGGNLFTKDEYGNFIFRFEFQLTPGANNGLGIRTPMTGDAAYVGMELQILDNDAPIYSDLEEYQYHGSVYGIMPAKRGYLKPVGEWNYQEVIANGDQIKITLNGTVILDGNLKEATKNGTVDKKEHPGLFNKKGHIGFLGHGSPVKFKNIRIKELK
ncbi:DUF1080 domain-containing protein [Dysgonomonas sp. ZJ709]|uniref:DUF1080 domain-containing protein n=1 Tax=Dysgonomonas sp. ZJ709 TaxID=2709797 RepID=UPI0013EB125E|nr:family 16 glycoside hydrolase [Dysgonomonas sp. ZJ709]